MFCFFFVKLSQKTSKKVEQMQIWLDLSRPLRRSVVRGTLKSLLSWENKSSLTFGVFSNRRSPLSLHPISKQTKNPGGTRVLSQLCVFYFKLCVLSPPPPCLEPQCRLGGEQHGRPHDHQKVKGQNGSRGTEAVFSLFTGTEKTPHTPQTSRSCVSPPFFLVFY